MPEFRNACTVEQMALSYDMMPWRKRLPRTAGQGTWRHGWIVLLDDGRHAILERRGRSAGGGGTPQWFAYDVLRVSSYRFTRWDDPDPQSHLGFGSSLPNEHWLTGRIVEIDDGDFVFHGRAHHRLPGSEIVGHVLRPLSWIEERDRV